MFYEGTDTVVICPTDAWNSPAERFENSRATLWDFQSVIDAHDSGSLTIQLLDGPCAGQDPRSDYYDLSAVLVPEPRDPSDPPGEEYVYFPLTDWDGSSAFVFNPKGYEFPVGIAIAGKHGITIQGPATVRGNDDPRALGDAWGVAMPRSSGLVLVNMAFTVLADGSTPARNTTIQDLTFEDCSRCTNAFARSVNTTFQDNTYRVDGFDPVDIWEQHTNMTVRDNYFYTDLPANQEFFPQAPINAGGVPALGGHTNLTIVGNVMENVMGAMRVFDHHQGTVVDNNDITLHPNGDLGIFGLAGSHGLVPDAPPDSAGSRISNNIVRGGSIAITMWTGWGWTIDHNTLDGQSFAGIHNEWGPLCFPGAGVIQLGSAENNTIAYNTVTNSFIGIWNGALGKNNTFLHNDVGGNTFGYVLDGAVPLTLNPCGGTQVTLAPPSGNTYVLRPGEDPDALFLDFSGCTGTCDLPLDDDGDGAIDEDPVDGIDNDGDGIRDEDAPETGPNVIVFAE